MVNLVLIMKKIVICGAGIAGIATAYYLSQQLGKVKIVLVDKHQPLSFTSSQSGENFRDYWPHHSMDKLCSRSIELMKILQKEFGFTMNFSGYHFVSQHKEKAIFTDDSTPEFQARNSAITDAKIIHQQNPYLSTNIQKSIFINNAGYVDSIVMANAMLQTAKDNGAQFIEDEVIDLQKTNSGIQIKLKKSQTISADQLIIAAGPFINNLAKMLDLKFPVWNTLQRKIIIPDPLEIIPRNMPFTIFADKQHLHWSKEEHNFFKSDETLHWLFQEFPGAIHIKPEASKRIKMGWAFSTEAVEPQWSIPKSSYFAQVLLKGASRFIPTLSAYSENIPTPLIEYGGYYTRTKENFPLIGPTAIDNVFIVGALAGFGTMAACAAGELCAFYLTEKDLPGYAPYFHPKRNKNTGIQKEIAAISGDGQL